MKNGKDGCDEVFESLVSKQCFIELDAGAYTTAKISLAFSADPDAVVRVIYAECYSVENQQGHRHKARRDAYDDPTARLDGIVDTIHATGWCVGCIALCWGYS